MGPLYLDQLRYRLSEGRLRIEPSAHFASIEEAKRYVDPFLESWEIDIALRFGSPELSFEYETAEVIDRDPPPPGPRHLGMVANAGELSLSGAIASLHVSRTRYPAPPPNFRLNPDVDTLWKRYQGYKHGREPLPSMAYFCLTLLETISGSREDAAAAFKISGRVLSKIGQLTTERGDQATARKYLAIKAGVPLSAQEIGWLEEAVKAIIRRLGEVQSIDTVPIIDVNSLPPLWRHLGRLTTRWSRPAYVRQIDTCLARQVDVE